MCVRWTHSINARPVYQCNSSIYCSYYYILVALTMRSLHGSQHSATDICFNYSSWKERGLGIGTAARWLISCIHVAVLASFAYSPSVMWCYLKSPCSVWMRWAMIVVVGSMRRVRLRWDAAREVSRWLLRLLLSDHLSRARLRMRTIAAWCTGRLNTHTHVQ